MTLRQLNVTASQWTRQDITEVREALANVGDDPDLARAWRGSVVLSFSEVKEGYPYLTPAIADYLKNLYSAFPYLLFYLDPEPAKGALDGFFSTLGALYEDQHRVWVMWSDAVATAFFTALADAAEFAINQRDDWVAVVRSYEYDARQTRESDIRKILIDRGVLGT